VSFIYSRVQGLEVSPSGVVLAGTENDIFRSSDAGATWTDTNANTIALDFAVNPDGTQGVSLLAGGSPAGIFKSTDDGVTWTPANNALDDFDVNSIAAVPNGSGGTNLLAGTYSGLFISTNDAGYWQRADLNTLPLDYAVTPNGSGGSNIFAGGFGGVWRSTDYGATWTAVNAGLTDKIVQGLAATSNGANLFAGGDPFGVYRSTDNGATWALVNNGLTDLRVYALLSPDGTNLFAGGAGGVFLSTDHGEHWTSVGAGLTTGVFSLAVSADGSTLLAGTTGLGVWKRSLSEMINVSPPPPPPPPPSITSFTPTSGPVGTEVTITGSNFGGASSVTFNGTPASSYTVDSGTQIRATVPSGAATGSIRVITSAGTAVSSGAFTVTSPPPPATLTFLPPHDAWVRSSSPSSNFGSTSELRVRSGSQTIRSYLKFDVSGVSGAIQSAKLRLRVIDAGPSGGSVFSVSNNFAGTSTPWSESGLTWNNAPAVGGSALAGIGAVSINTWVEVDVTSAVTGNGTFSFAVSGNSSNVVDYSSSEGANPPQLVVTASGAAAEVVSHEAMSPADSRGRDTVAAPGRIALDAYPNPFNPSTTIRYSVPRAMPVRLVIYDVTGRLVRRLVDGIQDAGDRRVTWDGRDEHGSTVGSGVYVYRLDAGGTRVTRKVNLLK
jgi:photosystem II stability/assembly factor-like uncharacterized protein